jgi:hypothetical protein
MDSPETKERIKAMIKAEIKAVISKTLKFNLTMQNDYYFAKAKKGSQFHLVNRKTHKAICRDFVKPQAIEVQLLNIPEERLCKNCLKEYHKGRRKNAI